MLSFAAAVSDGVSFLWVSITAINFNESNICLFVFLNVGIGWNEYAENLHWPELSDKSIIFQVNSALIRRTLYTRML